MTPVFPVRRIFWMWILSPGDDQAVLIAGIGSRLRGDDAIGPRVIDRLSNEVMPDYVACRDVGADPLDLLTIIPGYAKVIVIDAVRMGAAPGTVRVFSADQLDGLNVRQAVSSHGMGLSEVLALRGRLQLSTEIHVVAVEIQTIMLGDSLSDDVRQAEDTVRDCVLALCMEGD